MLYDHLKNELESLIPEKGSTEEKYEKMRAAINQRFLSIGAGAARKVYVYRHPDKNDDVIFKMHHGYHQRDNEKEYDVYQKYKSANSNLINFFLPPLAIIKFKEFGPITVFPRVEIVENVCKQGKGGLKYQGKCYKRFNAYLNFINATFHDTGGRNLGVYNDLPVMADYNSDGFNTNARLEEQARQLLEIAYSDEI